jgi:hypothetical protein
MTEAQFLAVGRPLHHAVVQAAAHRIKIMEDLV